MERLKLRHDKYLNVGVYFDIYSTTALRIKTGVSTVCADGKDSLYEKRVSIHALRTSFCQISDPGLLLVPNFDPLLID